MQRFQKKKKREMTGLGAQPLPWLSKRKGYGSLDKYKGIYLDSGLW
jgi:NaMN:DMB phosphoribosyltransferase